jgi:NAD(P)-dependent dehydrogenase (short-subunit alcohol dehydrogenase family)
VAVRALHDVGVGHRDAAFEADLALCALVLVDGHHRSVTAEDARIRRVTNTGEAGAPWSRGVDAGRRLAGKRAFITGAGTAGELTGIGEAMAVLFAAQGAQVGIADVSHERADATLRLVEEAGGTGVVSVGDLADLDENARCVAEVAEAFGGLDTVVNNVAISGAGGSPSTIDVDEWRRVMAVDLDAAVFTARHTLPHLVEGGGGSVINIASIAAIRGHGSGAYAAAKAALLGLTQDWAYVHGRDGIRVNCILPGHVYAPMGTYGGESIRELRRQTTLLGTEGEAWDIAWPAVFLASDESRWITGVELVVDAGTTTTTPMAMHLLNGRRPV